jgi:hypothetical protein
VEALGTEMIAPDGKASARAEVEDITAARERISRQQQRRRLARRRWRSPGV